ncbi:peptidoglycan editing factor PgeF [Yersinia kristensenii]|uniref:peptidoglycan editing factor PgeF n=1 Tax=Yersinia kristensenii TaxID=28152 RepID=UPI000C1E5838|nr:peptidoglycan editing factor PgeF [Yersinia kristensenii]MDA5474570.1 peptidoglycan editing factor PgeF [Yersinia kristensenii]MDA5478578.1 peptidoglycan editing factor PgeF [Yersinia kristensenii]MDA5505283.1 peptidoglycan editing factor PgeF [Yersinia kristensenii]NIK94172.1 peptidoglycan editing factor PgeF [Yersinia kristensenii]NIL05916.1 peptidoglycan editing factor PgeF [Yersinia kristensenii]
MTDFSPQLSRITTICHGFGNKSALLPDNLQPYKTSQANKKQVHGTAIVDVTHPGQECGEADGLYTTQSGILLTVLTADCLPVIFSQQHGKGIAVVHAGWRGLLDGIILRMVERIARDDNPANWVAAIGPAARSCCYEVNEELVERFVSELPLAENIISPRFRHLNLAAIAEHQLRRAGIHQVDRVGSCTICTTAPHDGDDAQYHFKYTSFRRTSQQQAIDPTHPGIKGCNQYSGLIILP